MWAGVGVARTAPGSPLHPHSLTLSRPMWTRSRVRKALELKEGELKAFFIKASAREKRPWGRESAVTDGCSPAEGTRPWHAWAATCLPHQSGEHRAAAGGPTSQTEGTASTKGKLNLLKL